MTKIEAVSRRVETQCDAVVDSDRTTADYADAAPIPADRNLMHLVRQDPNDCQAGFSNQTFRIR